MIYKKEMASDLWNPLDSEQGEPLQYHGLGHGG